MFQDISEALQSGAVKDVDSCGRCNVTSLTSEKLLIVGRHIRFWAFLLQHLAIRILLWLILITKAK